MTIAYRPKEDAEATPVAAPSVPAKPMLIDMAAIRVDGGTQSRAKLHEETIVDYADAIREGAKFPPVTVFYDGATYWLADGFHRHAAHHQAGKKKILADVRQGSRRDAILFSVGANANHGLRRTRDDKRRAVMTLLNDSEWSTWPNTKVAEQCDVSESFVRHLRLNEDIATQPVRTVTRGGATYSMDTTAIGGRKSGDGQLEEIASQTLAPQGVEVGDEPENQVAEITTSSGPSASSDDPFDPSPEPANTAPAAQSASPAPNETDEPAQVDQPAESDTGNSYLRGLVHIKVRGFDTFCKEHPPEFVAGGVRPDEVASMRNLVGRINKWLEAFLAAAKAGGKAS
jgi:uncharacterized ParB-like nuclease family protein